MANVNNILYAHEKKICTICDIHRIKNLILTDERLIFSERNSYYSVSLESIVSIRYTRSRKLFVCFVGVAAVIYSIYQYLFSLPSEPFNKLLLLFGFGMLVYYYLSRKSFIEIATKASEKIRYNVKVADPGEIRNFCG
jgi:hypothetical protein